MVACVVVWPVELYLATDVVVVVVAAAAAVVVVAELF